MTKDEKEKQKYLKWFDRIIKLESKVSLAIGKTTTARAKLWRACPHKWETHVHEYQGRKHYTCDVCGMIVPRPLK